MVKIMLLAKKFNYNQNPIILKMLNSFAFASNKLWNIANYEKHNYKDLGMDQFPNWYIQKKDLKNNFWYKCLPSTSAQELLKILQESWKSFFKLKKTNGIVNPKPPKFKKKGEHFNFNVLKGNFSIHKDVLRITIPKNQKDYFKEQFGFDKKYIHIKLDGLSSLQNIKLFEFIPKKDSFDIIAIYEIEDVPLKENGYTLSIDIGLKNLFSGYTNKGENFIIKNTYFLDTNRFYSKKIAKLQSFKDILKNQNNEEYKNLQKSISKKYEDRRNKVNYLLHAYTKKVVDFCIKNNIKEVVIGDIKHIRENKDFGDSTNQKLHSFPFDKLYNLLKYKLLKIGVNFIKIKEAYTSGVSPFAPKVSKEYYEKSKRIKRGLYKDQGCLLNSDLVGAYNIYRLYEQQKVNKVKKFNPCEIQTINVLKIQ